MKAKKRATAEYERMTTKKLAEATAMFNADMIVEKSAPLTKEERRWWNSVRRSPGRPRKGQGVKVISVSVEGELLAKSDVLAKNLGISRALLIERGLKAVLAAQGRLE
jgi:hypothetical protein